LGIHETFRVQAWTQNCREWVYFDCYIDAGAIRRIFRMADCVHDHSHRGTHDGSERGLVCDQCHQDGIMGNFERKKGTRMFPTPDAKS